MAAYLSQLRKEEDKTTLKELGLELSEEDKKKLNVDIEKIKKELGDSKQTNILIADLQEAKLQRIKDSASDVKVSNALTVEKLIHYYEYYDKLFKYRLKNIGEPLFEFYRKNQDENIEKTITNLIKLLDNNLQLIHDTGRIFKKI